MVYNHKKYELPQNPAVDHTLPAKIDIELRKSPSFLDKAMWTPRVYIFAAMFGKNNFKSIDINPNHNSRVLRAICVKVWGILPQHHQVHCHCCMASDTQRSVLWKCCDKYQYIKPNSTNIMLLIYLTLCPHICLHPLPIDGIINSFDETRQHCMTPTASTCSCFLSVSMLRYLQDQLQWTVGESKSSHVQ